MQALESGPIPGARHGAPCLRHFFATVPEQRLPCALQHRCAIAAQAVSFRSILPSEYRDIADDVQLPVYLRVRVRRTSGQARRPDFRCGARCHPHPRQERPRRLRDHGQDRRGDRGR